MAVNYSDDNLAGITTFEGENYDVWVRSLVVYVQGKGIGAVFNFVNKPGVSSPLEDPDQYLITAPDFTRLATHLPERVWVPGTAAHVTGAAWAPAPTAVQWRNAVTEHGVRTADNYVNDPSCGPDTITGMLIILSTTNTVTEIKAAIKEWQAEKAKIVTMEQRFKSIVFRSISAAMVSKLDLSELGEMNNDVKGEEIIKICKEFYMRYIKRNKDSLINELRGIRMGTNDTIESLMKRINECADKVKRVNAALATDSEKIRILLDACASKYPVVVDMKRGSEDLEDVLARLKLEETLKSGKGQHQARNDDRQAQHSALVADASSTPTLSQRFAQLRASNPRSRDTCNRCGKVGHWARECRQGRGYGGNQQQQPRNNGNGQGRSFATLDARFGAMNRATGLPGRTGGGRANNWSNRGNYGGNDRGGGAGGGVALMAAAGGDKDAEERVERHGGGAIYKENRKHNGDFNPSYWWIVDSGCNQHMTPNRELFVRFMPFDEEAYVDTAGEGPGLLIGGIGDVESEFYNEITRKWDLVTLTQVLYVPALTTNLISVSRAARRGNHVKFDDKLVVISSVDGSEPILTGELDRGLYIVRARRDYYEGIDDAPELIGNWTQMREQLRRSFLASKYGYKNNIDLWHLRLGHLGLDNLKRMAREQMVYGIDFDHWKDAHDIGTCEACIFGRSKRAPFPTPGIGSRPITEPLELVHADLCGPFPVESFQGFKYFLVLVDDFTAKTWVMFLKHKSETFDIFIEWLYKVEHQARRDLGGFQSDNGTEFVNETFDKFFKMRGITPRRSAPYTPQQNGRAENRNRELVGRARTMLKQANLPNRFWAEAIRHAADIMDVIPTRALDDMTPFQAWHNIVPNVAGIRIFGADAYAHVPSVTRQSKLADRAAKLVYVGMAEGSKAYRLIDRKTGALTISKDVTFDEGRIAKLKPSETDRSASPQDPENDSDPFPDFTQPPAADRDQQSPESSAKTDDAPTEGNGGTAPGTESIIGHNSGPAAAEGEDQSGINSEDDEAEDEGNRRSKRDKRTVLTAEEAMRLSPGEEWARIARRGQASFRANSNFAAALIADAQGVEIDQPNNVRQALAGPHRKQWLEALASEFWGLIENGTFRIDETSGFEKVLSGKFVLAVKTKADGTLAKFKARLVARGDMQREGMDYGEIFSPVTRYTSIRLLAALSTDPGLFTAHLDIKQAYLHANLDEELYLAPPEGSLEILNFAIRTRAQQDPSTSAKASEIVKALQNANEHGKKQPLRLAKTIYGLKQAGREWNKLLDSTLRGMGFTSTILEPCLYFKKDGNKWTIVAVYVDDLAWVSNDQGMLEADKESLGRRFQTTDLGDLNWFLGIRIQRTAGRVTLDQSAYITETLNKYGMLDCRPLSTPIDLHVKLTKEMAPKTRDERSLMARVPFRNAVGTLMYLAISTRPDIATAVGRVARFMEDPGPLHWLAVKRIMRYLQGTRNLGLVYTNSGSDLVGYCDADWGSEVDDRKSTTGYAFILGNGAISWQSKRQPTVALSSAEAEYMAATSATKEALWLRQILEFIGIKLDGPTIIYSDSQSAIGMIGSETVTSTSKHIALRIHFLRDHVVKGDVKFIFIGTDLMGADILTKGIQPEPTRVTREILGVFAIDIDPGDALEGTTSGPEPEGE